MCIPSVVQHDRAEHGVDELTWVKIKDTPQAVEPLGALPPKHEFLRKIRQLDLNLKKSQVIRSSLAKIKCDFGCRCLSLHAAALIP